MDAWQTAGTQDTLLRITVAPEEAVLSLLFHLQFFCRLSLSSLSFHVTRLVAVLVKVNNCGLVPAETCLPRGAKIL